MTKGLAAEPFGNPYRWKPLAFKISGATTTYAWKDQFRHSKQHFPLYRKAEVSCQEKLPEYFGMELMIPILLFMCHFM
jgi:hypothetical protein